MEKKLFPSSEYTTVKFHPFFFEELYKAAGRLLRSYKLFSVFPGAKHLMQMLGSSSLSLSGLFLHSGIHNTRAKNKACKQKRTQILPVPFCFLP